MFAAVHYPIRGGTASEIAASVEDGVRAGALAPGALLPPVRTLAGELGVSPGTVAAAYRVLRERAVVATAGRRGTSIRPRPAVAVRDAVAPAAPAGVRDLASGAPDPALLPALGPLLRRLDPPGCGYTDPALLPALAAAAEPLLARDGVPTGALTATAGALDGIERVLQAVLRPGDRVAVEDPGWPGLLDLLPALGLRPVAVEMDDDGPNPDGLAAALAGGARAAVVTSRAQNPTGAVLTPRRAAALRRVLRRHPDTLLVEDDHAAQLAGDRIEPLAGSTARWVFVRSFSKPFGPDLRLALLAGDPATVARVDGRRRLGAGWVSYLSQALGAALLTDPAVAETVGRAAAEYDRRRGELRRLLAEHGVSARGTTGINVWVPVPDETRVVAGLLTAGWSVAAGAGFRLASPPAVRLTVSGLGPADLPVLAGAVAAAVRPPPPRPV